ncbi:peptidoglycan DD-metalloendopeptidase family protein [Oceaniserpentilla sp. 4NH20-0058]|uniref:peptidoglycan DD-metalloendopeptidase family protein n=1 Tax=Oceaniserpentilla sp. 4NH20-0058 TaxID=3127660 RepID=UPI003106A4C2
MQLIFKRLSTLFTVLLCSTLLISNTHSLPQSSLVPGGIAVIPLQDAKETQPQAFYNKKPIAVIQHNQTWFAVAGLKLSTKTGEHFIVSQGKRYPFTVTDKQYEEQHITLKTRKHIDLSEADLKRHRGEKKRAQAVFKVFENTPMDLSFIKPVDGPYSSPFGLKRFFNGEPRNPHSGLDIAAPTGTPILSPSRGKVVLTGDFFFNGNAVYVDHGQGLISMFCHLSEIEVEIGDTLKKGQPIGKVGATGRVTGPHLHWSVSLNNARIDPMLLLP